MAKGLGGGGREWRRNAEGGTKAVPTAEDSAILPFPFPLNSWCSPLVVVAVSAFCIRQRGLGCSAGLFRSCCVAVLLLRVVVPEKCLKSYSLSSSAMAVLLPWLHAAA